MNVLVCIKRVPMPGARISLTDDGLEVDTRFLGFTVGPHEECAVEEAVRLVEAHGGASTVLTLGPEAAAEQLRAALALGIGDAALLETDDPAWGPQGTAAAIAEAVRSGRLPGRPFDLLLFGNEAADTADHQVGVRVAHTLGLPCVTGAKGLEVADGAILVEREAPDGGRETLTCPLPAVVTVKEGINLPRFPSVPGRLKAKKKEIERIVPSPVEDGLRTIRLMLPADAGREVRVLGEGPGAAPEVVRVLRDLGLVG